MEQSKFYQIKNITEQEYTLVGCDGSVITRPIQDIDKSASAFTIQDAKDGDVLCYKDEISLYKHDIKNCTKQETTFGGFVYHCCYDGRRFITDSLYSLTEQDKMDIHPATKEQRDLLFQKMNESGYVWDAEKKELKKIEPIDEYEGLTDFERTLADICIGWIGKEIGWKQYIKDNADVLLKIAVEKFNSVQDVPFEQKPTDEEMKEALRTEYEKGRADVIAEMQNPAWGEEDEHRIKDTVYFLDTAKKYYASTEELDACIDWVKSLKPQNMCVYNPYKAVVESIAEMCKHYDKASHSGLRDFYDNVKVKCKDAKEYDSLYPQNCWKPSDVQMKALDDALSLAKNCGEENAFDLRTLYEQLKKLNEE